ncbi:hypothetical protein MRY87_05705 [bacterium]|nr:hypothetical protein [bacterium]
MDPAQSPVDEYLQSNWQPRGELALDKSKLRSFIDENPGEKAKRLILQIAEKIRSSDKFMSPSYRIALNDIISDESLDLGDLNREELVLQIDTLFDRHPLTESFRTRIFDNISDANRNFILEEAGLGEERYKKPVVASELKPDEFIEFLGKLPWRIVRISTNLGRTLSAPLALREYVHNLDTLPPDTTVELRTDEEIGGKKQFTVVLPDLQPKLVDGRIEMEVRAAKARNLRCEYQGNPRTGQVFSWSFSPDQEDALTPSTITTVEEAQAIGAKYGIAGREE